MSMGLQLGLVLGSGSGGTATFNSALTPPVLALGVAGNVYPPQVDVVIDDTAQADINGLELWAASDVAFTSPSKFTHTPITNAEALANAFTMSGLSAISSPAVTYFKARITSSGLPSDWSNIILHGDIVAPTVTSSAVPSGNELAPMAYVVTANKAIASVTVPSGADASLLEVSGTTVRLVGNANLDYETKSSYAFTVRVYSYNGLFGELAVTFTVNDINENPSGLSGFFADVTGASFSTDYTSNTYTVAGLAGGISVPVTVSAGTYSKNGGAYTSAAGTVTNGDTITLKRTSGAADGNVVSTVLTVGGGSDTWSITNINTFNPATLFGGGDNGYFYDISDLTTVFSDTAGTVQASVNGAVKRINDKSGKGNHLIWASGNTLTLRQSGSFYYLEAAAAVGVTNASVTMVQPWSRISAMRVTAWTVNARILGEISTNGSLFQKGSSAQMAVDDSGAGAQPIVNATLNADVTVSEFHSNASSTLQLDNNTAQTGTSGASNNDGVTLFNRNDGTRPGQGWLYASIGINRDLSPSEEASCRTWVAGKYGGSL